jgi:hypothetical protein
MTYRNSLDDKLLLRLDIDTQNSNLDCKLFPRDKKKASTVKLTTRGTSVKKEMKLFVSFFTLL